jgi:hypothetical protein
MAWHHRSPLLSYSYHLIPPLLSPTPPILHFEDAPHRAGRASTREPRPAIPSPRAGTPKRPDCAPRTATRRVAAPQYSLQHQDSSISSYHLIRFSQKRRSPLPLTSGPAPPRGGPARLQRTR